MLKSDRIKLRAVEPEDLDLMYVIENDTELWSLGQTTVPFSHHALRQYLVQSTGDLFRDRQLRLVIENTEGEESIAIGFLDLENYDPKHCRAEVGIVVAPEWQRHGIASEALHLLDEYASAHLGMHQLYALVPENNYASASLFGKLGYEKTATLQDWLKSPVGWQTVFLFQKML